MNSPLIAAAWLASASPAAITDSHIVIDPVVAPALDRAVGQRQLPNSPVYFAQAVDADADGAVSSETQDADAPLPDEQAEPGAGEVAITEEVSEEEQPPSAEKGVIIVSGSADKIGRDPLVELNEASFELTQDVDQALVAPIADAYERGLPKPIRRGMRNFFRNLLEPVNFLNYLLQFKPGKAFETLGRFAINSTVGAAGFIDIAKREPFNLPYRRNGFSNTLGYYGVGHGPFLFVPLVGATTLRDLIGSFLDQSIVPLALGRPFNTPYYAIPAYTVNSLESRIEFDEKLNEIRESDDPYFAARETYLCNREADIAWLKNRPPARDCSIEALMSEGAPLVGVGADLTPAELEAAGTSEAVAAPAEQEAAAAEPVVPEIRYISEEVVQPLP